MAWGSQLIELKVESTLSHLVQLLPFLVSHSGAPEPKYLGGAQGIYNLQKFR